MRFSFSARLASVVLMCLFGFLEFSYAQEELLFTRSFTNKCRNSDVTFYMPVETKLLPTTLKRDAFLKYDLCLTDQADIEVRIIIDELSPQRSQAPNVRFQSVLATLASNDEDHFMRISLFDNQDAEAFFNAEWAAYAEFVPKSEITNKRYGLLECLYLSDRAQVFIIVLHDKETLSLVYSRLMAFKSSLSPE